MSQPPTCSKCGRDHWNFRGCEDTSPARVSRGAKVEWLPNPEGVSDWGDRLHTLERRGTTLFQKEATGQGGLPVAHRVGKLTYPKGTDGPRA